MSDCIADGGSGGGLQLARHSKAAEDCRTPKASREENPDQHMPTGGDQWSLKEYRPRDSAEVWFFRKNLAPEVPVRHPDYCFVAYLTFAYQPRDESGLPTNEDEEVLFRIEESELGPLVSDGLAVQIASVTKGGIKDLIFHTRDPDEFCAGLRAFAPDMKDLVSGAKFRLIRNGTNMMIYRKGRVFRSVRDEAQPRCGWNFWDLETQGGSCVATLGFGVEYRWDSGMGSRRCGSTSTGWLEE